MKLRRNLIAALLAGVLALFGIACNDEGDGAADTDTETEVTETETDGTDDDNDDDDGTENDD